MMSLYWQQITLFTAVIDVTIQDYCRYAAIRCRQLLPHLMMIAAAAFAFRQLCLMLPLDAAARYYYVPAVVATASALFFALPPSLFATSGRYYAFRLCDADYEPRVSPPPATLLFCHDRIASARAP